MKIGNHFTTSPLTEGLSIALLGSVWLYGAWLGLDWRVINTVAGVLFLYWLLAADRKVWFWSGFFIGLLWFGWIAVSFVYYHMAWAIPFALAGIGLIYGGIFWAIAGIALGIARLVSQRIPSAIDYRPSTGARTSASYHSFIILVTKSLGLLTISYLHPFTFDWFKPELVFVHSYLGVTKWQFAIVLAAITLAQWRRDLLWLGLIMLAYSPTQVQTLPEDPSHTFRLVTTHTTVTDKWDPALWPQHINKVLRAIDTAIEKGYRVVVLPESVFPFFLNRRPDLLGKLLKRSRRITIIMGALYYDHGIHRNATYLFQNGRYSVAHKVLLVPFGEANPLPQWAGRWVNRIFFDGTVDYIASAQPTDWKINATRYRNAICYEATSERLYEGHPEKMIVLSNNAWFVPSIEPTFQRLLMSYYVRKYRTTIYHVTNMSSAYILRPTPP